MNKKLKYFLTIVFILTLTFGGLRNIQAETLAEFKAELSEAEKKYENNQYQKEQTEEEIQAANKRIVELNRQREETQNNIKDLEGELKQLASDIEVMKDEIKKIVNYYQLSSSNPIYLEYIFNASTFTDFIYRLAITEQLSEYRNETIDKYNKLIEENKKKINELAAKQVDLEKLQKEVSAELTKLGNNLSKITEEAVDIKEEIAGLKRWIDIYENTYKCSLNEDLTACLNRQSGGAYIPSATGFYRPIVSGALNYEYGYTAKYGAYHDGVDFSVPHGTPVYSVADGVVVSVAPRQSCGGNMVYIGHEVGGRSYTSAYFHLASINVREGQVVTHNTVIGYSGGVHAIEWWDSLSCSTGAHLHFQIATGIYKRDYLWYSDFRSRSFNPRDVIYFPPTDVPFYGR